VLAAGSTANAAAGGVGQRVMDFEMLNQARARRHRCSEGGESALCGGRGAAAAVPAVLTQSRVRKRQHCALHILLRAFALWVEFEPTYMLVAFSYNSAPAHAAAARVHATTSEQPHDANTHDANTILPRS
jgi:hypothetical protein